MKKENKVVFGCFLVTFLVYRALIRTDFVWPILEISNTNKVIFGEIIFCSLLIAFIIFKKHNMRSNVSKVWLMIVYCLFVVAFVLFRFFQTDWLYLVYKSNEYYLYFLLIENSFMHLKSKVENKFIILMILLLHLGTYGLVVMSAFM